MELRKKETSTNYLKLAVLRIGSTLCTRVREKQHWFYLEAQSGGNLHLEFRREWDTTENGLYGSVISCCRSRTGFLLTLPGLPPCNLSMAGPLQCTRFPDAHIVLKHKW